MIDEKSEIRETANGVKLSTILLDVVRPFKNDNGEHDSNRISVTLWKSIAETVNNFSRIGNDIGVKGSIQTRIVEKEKCTFYNYEHVAEHIAFKLV